MLVAVLIGIMISIVVGVSLVPVIISSSASVAAFAICDNVSHATQFIGTVGTTHGVYATGNCSGTYTQVASTGLVGLVSILSYVFVAIILLGAVAWIGGQG